jgi:signal transduction histidine kinase/ActR/RegA family two-component response regulator
MVSMPHLQSVFSGGGRVGELMRSHEWTSSPLGPPERWPHSLRTVVDLLLQSRFPMFVAWGPELGFLYNDPYAEILGAKHPAALGRRFYDIWSEIWPDISPLIDAAMNGQASYREDLPLVMNRKGYDEQTWFTFSYSPVRDEAGKVAGMFCACTETTEKVLNEERLREADRRKDEFIAMLAHELRNPLAPIRTGLELIRVAGNTPDAVERVRGMIERQIAHMVRLIDDLLDVSRITSGKIQLQREPTPLDSLLNSAIDANRGAIVAKQIRLEVDVPETVCVLDVDPTRFVQVVSNLLHNATKFTDPGGFIHVSARVSEGDVPVPRLLTLSVADSGIGIPADFLPRVFDLFTQGDRESSQPGLGIGLALARRLVEMHGGRIEVRSDGAGQGSEFRIELPLSTLVPASRIAASIEQRSIECRVIVIDDNRDAATATAMLVEALGGECRTAADGECALRDMRDHRPDVVLLDIGMPGVDGYEICRRIRHEFGDDILVVALTGFGQEQDKARAQDAGFSAHLTKPADPAALTHLLVQCRRPALKTRGAG